MASRREFLQVGVAALTLPISARAGRAEPVMKPNRNAASLAVYKVIFDERFPDSVAFGLEARRLGLSSASIRGDITDLWFYDLDPQWKKSPAAIAGLTAQGALFCLERLAWDHGMRVVFRADHDFLPDGPMQHDFTGAENVVEEAARLRDHGEAWPAYLAGRLARFPEIEAASAKVTIRTHTPRSTAGRSENLISWLIAPVTGVPILRKA